MIAYVTTMGEPTTDLCIWSLKRNGFEVHTVSGDDSLASKLTKIYNMADHDFVRVDADVIVNKTFTVEVPLDIWWAQFQTFDWYKQDITNGGVQFIRKECLDILRKHTDEIIENPRPETYMYRLEEFGNPRRCQTINKVVGIHGYGIRDYEYVKQTKELRGQKDYDFDLVERLNRL